MADNIVTFQGHCVATDEILGCHHLRTKLTFGADGAFSDVSSSNPLPISIISGGQSGGLTDTQLRASPVPVSGTVSVTGPLTDTQLRASPLGVAGAFYQATQPVSIASMPSTPVTGTFWQATQPVSIGSMPTTPVTGTFWQTTQPVSGTVTITPPVLSKGTQGATGISTQDLKDAGRVARVFSAAFTAATTEALVTLTPITDGATGSTGTSFTITSGKRLRLQSLSVSTKNAAAAGQGIVCNLRMTATGAVAANSPLVATCGVGTYLAIANVGGGNCVIFPDGFELSGTSQFGISQVGTATAGNTVTLIAYEY